MSRLARALGAACVAVAACSWKLQSAGPLTAPCASRSRARIQLDKTVDGEIRVSTSNDDPTNPPRARIRRAREGARRHSRRAAPARGAAGRRARERLRIQEHVKILQGEEASFPTWSFLLRRGEHRAGDRFQWSIPPLPVSRGGVSVKRQSFCVSPLRFPHCEFIFTLGKEGFN